MRPNSALHRAPLLCSRYSNRVDIFNLPFFPGTVFPPSLQSFMRFLLLIHVASPNYGDTWSCVVAPVHDG
jgi:hypothetical protein